MRLFPRSLKGQLIVLTLVALLVSQAASFWAILSDQRSRMATEWFHNQLMRIATVNDVIESTPAEHHAKIIRSVTVWGLRFVIESKPSVNAGERTDDDAIRTELKRVFHTRADDVAIAVFTPLSEESQLELLFGDLWRDVKRTLFPRSSLIPKPPIRPAYAHISIPLKSGQWLNIVVMPRGFAPPASPLLIQLATMAAISAVGIAFVLGRLTRPLKKLARAAAALGRGESSAFLDEKGPSEVVETIHAFNEMQERLSRFVQDRTKMLAALGHDLRTPITTLKLRAEFIDDDDTRQRILETLDEMLEMAEATLSFAREEAAQEETRLVDVGALISSVCADLSGAGKAVICADAGSFTMRCRPVGLKRALRNIIENAVAYGKCAQVSIEHRGGGDVAIMIDDEGPGIDPADMERVFKPFVRLESSRSRETGGVGLGLAIARSIIRSHGGDIILRNRKEGGLRAVVSLHGATVLEMPEPATAQGDKETVERDKAAA